MCSKWVAENGLMEHGGARLKDFCAHFGIDSQTYYRWLENADFADAIKKGKNEFKEKLEQRLVESLSKAACGYEFEETKTEYEGKKVKKKIVTVKNVEANVGAAIQISRWRTSRSFIDLVTQLLVLPFRKYGLCGSQHCWNTAEAELEVHFSFNSVCVHHLPPCPDVRSLFPLP